MGGKKPSREQRPTYAEAVLRRREASAETVLETSPFGFLMIDRSGRIVRANRRVEQMLGFEPGELAGRSVETLLPERFRTAHARHRSGFFADPRVRPMGLGLDLAARRKDGREFPVEISLSYVESDEGLLALAFITDVTPRKEAAKRLQAEFAVTRVFTEFPAVDQLAPRLLQVLCEELGWEVGEFWGFDGDVLRWHAGWRQPALDIAEFDAVSRRTVLSRGMDLPGRLWDSRHALWTQDLRKSLVAARAEVAARLGLRVACALPIHSHERASGIMVLLGREAREPNEEGLRILSDIGSRIGQHFDLRRSQEELSRQREILFQSEKLAALGRLVAGVAHEMNNPLGIISSRIELMLAEAADLSFPAQHLDDLKVVHRNVLRVAGVAQALRSFARQSTGERRPVNLNTVVEETLLLTGKPLSTDNIRVTTALDPGLPLLLGDANALQQVLLNLLTNAREALAGGGQISVETGPVPEQRGRIRLVVADTGPGIAPVDLPHLFEPFYTTKPAGTGLGLAVSYGIVQDHQGTIEVRSTPGQGATFTLTFPTLEPAALPG